jgi:hypothetical protein
MVRNGRNVDKKNTTKKRPKQEHDKKCHEHRKKELKRLRLPCLQLQQKHKAKNTTHLTKKHTLASPMEAAFS